MDWMPKSTDVPADRKAAAQQLRAQLKDRPPIDQVLTPEEAADAAPFYFALRSFVGQLKCLRQKQGLTLAEVAERSGLAMETLSRLETGSLVNPTWQTLGNYAVALGGRLRLLLDEPTDPTENP
jgi:DNA-binding XRE family transcriptional regulator